MLDRFRSLIIGLSLIVIVGLLALYFIVQIGGGEDVFGGKEGSLPPVNFATLEYEPEDNGYLLCAPGACGVATADSVSPTFGVDAGQLRQIFVDFADSNPTIQTFRFNLVENQFDFTERLPGNTFPAVITVKIQPIDAYSSTMSLYSRQPVGDSDKSDHADRASRWLRVLLTATGAPQT